LRVTPDPLQIATEGALWGSVHAHCFLHNAVVLSDDAGQFAVGRHALCWVHAERLVHKLDTFTDLHRSAQQQIRALIWGFYADLKAYRAAPTARRRSEMRARFGADQRQSGLFVRRLKRAVGYVFRAILDTPSPQPMGQDERLLLLSFVRVEQDVGASDVHCAKGRLEDWDATMTAGKPSRHFFAE
jgi:hypothetical protein